MIIRKRLRKCSRSGLLFQITKGWHIRSPLLKTMPYQLANQCLGSLERLQKGELVKCSTSDVESQYKKCRRARCIKKDLFENNICFTHIMPLGDVQWMIGTVLQATIFQHFGMLYRQKRGLAWASNKRPIQRLLRGQVEIDLLSSFPTGAPIIPL